ncbi:MAG: hypothetical protein EOM37_11420 [Proteobacteria bacterium]|nr:hypothetical protein [Pseudomonadota bacterium]
MESNRTFTNVDDDVLVKRIAQAKQRVVFVAPGLRQAVAGILEKALDRLAKNVTVILDVDAEVCRLGYGDENGLDAIQKAMVRQGKFVLHQPGVRIGLLIIDNDTIVYSPVPLLIEAGSTQPEKPNAIVLTASVPPAIEAACGVDKEQSTDRQIGLLPVSSDVIAAVKKELQENPPKEFDIARTERIFNSSLHFIELEILDYRLRTKKVKLDAELFGMTDHYLKNRVENTFKPFDDDQFLTIEILKLDKNGKYEADQTEVFGPRVIENERSQIKKEFLFDIPKFGVVIRRKHKNDFERRLKCLDIKIQLYIEAVDENIKQHIEKSKSKLIASLIPGVIENPPASWRKFMDFDNKLSKIEAQRLLGNALENIFKGLFADFKPSVRWIYKDVTYETIHNPDFKKILEKYFGKEGAVKLFGEYDAAPEIGTIE